MSLGIHVWDDLLDLYLPDEDRVKLEWAIGAALLGGTKNMVIITGSAASGKSTVLSLISQVLGDRPDVSVHHDVTKDLPVNTSHTFSTAHTFVSSEDRPKVTGDVLRFVLTTTGETIPFEHYSTLVKTASDARAEIADQCKHMYRELGADYYNQEEVTK